MTRTIAYRAPRRRIVLTNSWRGDAELTPQRAAPPARVSAPPVRQAVPMRRAAANTRHDIGLDDVGF
jgi:hypothetical protein